MYKQCRSERSAARQQELEQGLLTIMAAKPYEDISVTDICDRLGIPRKSFYRYFSGKDGALEALIDHTLMRYETFSAQSRNGEERALQHELETFFRFWIEEKALLDAMERNGLSAMLIHRCVNNAVSNNALPRRLLAQEKPEERSYLTMFATCGLMSLVVSWHHGRYAEPVDWMASTAIRLLCKPLFPDVDRLL